MTEYKFDHNAAKTIPYHLDNMVWVRCPVCGALSITQIGEDSRLRIMCISCGRVGPP